jgi:hypothetical protein
MLRSITFASVIFGTNLTVGCTALIDPPIVRIEDDRSEVLKLPDGWGGSNDSRASGGHYIASQTKDSSVRLSFDGRHVSWIGLLDGCSGQSRVTIDDDASWVIDGYRPNGGGGGWQQVVFSSPDLAPGQHTIVIRVLGTSSNACGAWIYVDAFDVRR